MLPAGSAAVRQPLISEDLAGEWRYAVVKACRWTGGGGRSRGKVEATGSGRRGGAVRGRIRCCCCCGCWIRGGPALRTAPATATPPAPKELLSEPSLSSVRVTLTLLSTRLYTQTTSLEIVGPSSVDEVASRGRPRRR